MIGKIAPADIQKLIDENSEHPRTCKKIMIELKQIIDLAISDDMLDRSPIRKIIVPKARKKHKRPLTDEEVKLLEKTRFTPREKLYITLIQFYGLRKEEALALSPADLENGFVSVNKAIVFKNNRPYIKITKSTAGERKIPILSIHKRYFAEIVRKGGLYCFTCISSNDLITEQSFRRMYYSIMKKLKLTARKNKLPEPVGLTSHIFRHNYATMLYYAGVGVKDAQYLLGHATSSVTLDIYTHLDNENKAAKNQLETYLKSK